MKEQPDEYWKEKLTPEQYDVLRNKGTERPFTGAYDDFYEEGQYQCAACGTVLFASDDKYNAGCGWPSFSAPATEEHILKEQDDTLGMQRTEVLCKNCGGHLGHLFDDGPAPTNQRFCINSAALQFKKED